MTRCRSRTGSRDHRFSADQAREAAQRFVQDSVSGFSADRQFVGQEAVIHLDGDALRQPRRRAIAAGEAGARAVTAEVDRRTAAVVHLSAAQGTADAAAFPVSPEDASAAARAALGDEHLPTAAAGDTRHAGRRTVTIDHCLSGRAEALFRDIERLETDARTRAVPGRRGAYGIEADRSLPVAEGVPRTVTRYRYGGARWPPPTLRKRRAAPPRAALRPPASARWPCPAPRTRPPFRTRTLTAPAMESGVKAATAPNTGSHGDGLGMVYDTGNFRADAAAHHYQPNPCTFTPKSISPTTRHKKTSGGSYVRLPAHRNGSGFLRPAAAERREPRPRGHRPKQWRPILQSDLRYRHRQSVRHLPERFAMDPPRSRQDSR